MVYQATKYMTYCSVTKACKGPVIIYGQGRSEELVYNFIIFLVVHSLYVSCLPPLQ